MSLSSLSAESSQATFPVRPRDHTVQFYEDDDFLCNVVAEYVNSGLKIGAPAILIATDAHRRSFCQKLQLLGVDIEQESSYGRLTLLDANEVLSRISLHGKPQWHLFEREVGAIVEALERTRAAGGIRAYGEMVDLLWRGGRSEAAIELEEMWNRLSRSHRFSLLCAYSLANFQREGDADAFARVCDTHDHVLPTESYAQRDEVARLREVTSLQQRAIALENEIKRRKELEDSLREALAARQRLDEELRRHNDELARAVRFSEMFVGMLGHDLRNPLSAITTAAQVLSRRAESDRVLLPAKRITSSAARMSRMIDQLLDFTRIRLGSGIPLERAPVDLLEIVRGVVDELEFGPVANRIRIEWAGDVGGQWDGDRLGQLASNLLGNALAHGAADQPVSARIDGTNDPVVFEVHNRGAMPAEALAGLFQPFGSGVEKRRQHSGGFGLGLYITQQIVLAHSGTIEVTSSLDDGTRVIVTLPRTDPAVSARTGGGSSG
jgi:signal transduction histidine kinase